MSAYHSVFFQLLLFSHMSNCPELYSNSSSQSLTFGVIFMDSCAVLTAFVHPYVVYCIIFRSTSAMKTYRWYLLWHQVCCCIADLFINVVAKPAVFFPLPAGYIRGIARDFISAKAALSLGISLVELGMVCTLHLFMYRYCAISGKTLFDPLVGGFLAWSYCWAALSWLLTYTATTDTYKTLEEWKTEYPICVYEALISVPGIFAYDKMEAIKKTFAAMIYGVVTFNIWMPLTVSKCMKGIKVEVMSNNLRRMHRKFLVQLIIQATLPFTLVVIPISLIVITVSCEIFGLNFINDLVWCSISLFGVSGGIALVAMNQCYYSGITRFFPQKTTITVVPSSIGAPSSTNITSRVSAVN